MPSTGLDKWYQLEARSQRSNIQGSIRLKLWLSTREDHGQACAQNNFDNWTDVRRHERLLTIFADYEMSLTKSVCDIVYNLLFFSDFEFLSKIIIYFPRNSRAFGTVNYATRQRVYFISTPYKAESLNFSWL